MTPVAAIGNTPMPTYTWGDLGAGTTYVFMLKDAAGTIKHYVHPAGTCAAGTCSYTPALSLPTGSYTWYVQAVSSAGTSQWGVGKSFTVTRLVAPGAVVQIGPGGAGIPAIPTYTWTDLGAGVTYYHMVQTAGGMIVQNNPAVGTCVAGVCSYTPAKALAAGSYRWFVLAANASGNGPWGTGSAFTVDPPLAAPGAIVQNGPGGAGVPAIPTYTWTDLGVGTTYVFMLRDSAGTIKQYVPSAGTCTAGSCSYTPVSKIAAGSYVWYVMAYNAAGSGPWGTGTAFTVEPLTAPGAVVQISPGGAGVPAIPTYTWTDLGAGVTYYHMVQTVGGMIEQYNPAVGTCVAGTCSYTPTKALAAGSHRWFLLGANAAGSGPWGTGAAFTTP